MDKKTNTDPSVVKPQSKREVAPDASYTPAPSVTNTETLASASSLGLGNTSSKTNWLKALRTLVVLAVVAVVAWGGALLYTTLTDYGVQNLRNGDYAYTFKFDKLAKQVTVKNTNYLTGGGLRSSSKLTVVAKETNNLVITNCQSFGDDWTLAYRVTFEGREYKVCTAKQLVYTTVLEKDDTKHLFEVVATSDKPINQTTLAAILGSITITKAL